MTTQTPWIYRFSWAVTLATVFLILAGGLVTSHEAGLAVPDWPTSYGQWFPPMVGNVFWEHGHRMIAGAVGILTLLLALCIQFKVQQKNIKILAWTAVVAVMLQALLGGLTVIMMLPAAISITHACLAQTFLCLLVALTYYLGSISTEGYQEKDAEIEDKQKRLRRLCILTTGFIYLQLVLGAAVRHTGSGIVFHILVAFLIIIHAVLLISRINRYHDEVAPLVHLSIALGVLVLIQFFLGIGSFVTTNLTSAGYAPSGEEIFFTAIHQTTGAVILATSFLMALMAHRQVPTRNFAYTV